MPNVNSNTNVNYNLTVKNNLNKSLSTIFKNVTERNLDEKQIQNCIANVQANQRVASDVGGKITGDVDITDISQNQTITSIAKCLNRQSSIDKTLSTLKTVANSVIRDQLTSKSTSAITVKEDNTVKSEGVFSVFTKLGSMFKSMQWILIVFIIVGGIAAVIGGYYYMQNGGKLKRK
jgi:hypothetical protein